MLGIEASIRDRLMVRSTCIHPDHKSTLAAAFRRNGILTQVQLAENLLIALSTVNNFCRGINVSVSKFTEICDALGLEPSEICRPLDAETSLEDKCENDATPMATAQFFAYDAFWVGRESLITELTNRLHGSCRLLLVAGLSGIGKTALSERLTLALQTQRKGDRFLRENCDNPNDNDFASFAARLLEGCNLPITPEERGQSDLLSRRLVAYLQANPTLVLIDSLEQILQGNETVGWSEFKDPGFLSFFRAILATPTFQSRFILTSQERPPELDAIASRYPNFYCSQPLTGLDEIEQQALFEQTGFTPHLALTRIGKAYEGHPLALRTILGEIGDRPFFGNVDAYWKRYGKEIEAVEQAIAQAAAGHTMGADDKWRLDRFTRALQLSVQQRLEYAFARLHQDAKFAYILLCESSVYRCPVPEDWWLSHLEDWAQDDTEQLKALEVLRDRYLVEEKFEDTELLLKQHNLIRSISLAHLKELTFEEQIEAAL